MRHFPTIKTWGCILTSALTKAVEVEIRVDANEKVETKNLTYSDDC